MNNCEDVAELLADAKRNDFEETTSKIVDKWLRGVAGQPGALARFYQFSAVFLYLE
jgi:hypothetical protein